MKRINKCIFGVLMFIGFINGVSASVTPALDNQGRVISCQYSLAAQGETFQMTVKIKKSKLKNIGKLTSTDLQITNQKQPFSWKVDYKQHIDLNKFITADGLNCIDLNVEACKSKKESRAYWKETSGSKICDDNKTNNEEVSTDPEFKRTTDTSHFTSTNGETIKFLKKIYGLIKIVIPLLIIVLSLADFLKVLFLSDDKNYKEAYSRFLKRIFIGIVLLLVPVLVSFVINIAGMGDNGILTIFA